VQIKEEQTSSPKLIKKYFFGYKRYSCEL